MSGRGGLRGAGRGGRGAYYKNLYGRGGRVEVTDQSSHSTPASKSSSSIDDMLSRGPADLGRVIGTKAILQHELNRIDGKSYGAYKDLKGMIHNLGSQF